jgi:hypothetical protein
MRFLFAVVGVLVTGMAGGAAAQCPASTFFVGCVPFGLQVDSPLAAASYTGAGVVPWTAGQGCPYACYDARRGVLVASGTTTSGSDCQYGPQMIDRYQLVGAPRGVPIAFQAVLGVHGSIVGAGEIHGTLIDGHGASSHESWSTTQVDGAVILAIQSMAEETFELRAVLIAQGGGAGAAGSSAAATADLRFSGLPEGVTVVSCQGYDLPVPVAGSTWGRIKATFR